MEQIIEFFGSKAALARALGVEKPSVSYWLENGLPPRRAIEIERLTEGKIKAIDIMGIKA